MTQNIIVRERPSEVYEGDEGGDGQYGPARGAHRRLFPGWRCVVHLIGRGFSLYAARLRRRLFAHLLELPSLFFTRQKAGDISTRVSSDVEAIQSILTSGLVSLARALLTLVLALMTLVGLEAILRIE